MISILQLKAKTKRKYWPVLENLLAGEGESLFPLTMPADKSLPGNYEGLRRSVGQLVEGSKEKKGFGFTILYQERNTLRFGLQSLPDRLSFDTPEDLFRFINKKNEAENILSRARQVCAEIPQLEPWVSRNPRKILDHLDQWEHIIAVLHFFQSNPRPRMYARELPIKVHTKFVEKHKAILRELLTILIPEHINRDGETFAEQFSLLTAPPLVRLRQLDNTVDKDIFHLANDLALPLDAFNRLTPQAQTVVITENQMTFLTLPPLENTIAIYGGGFRVEILKKTAWLKNKTIIYWGDIDDHGFRILSMLRASFPSTISLMMDLETFNQFQDYCGKGVDPRQRQTPRLNLTEEETALHQRVKENNQRLEQEHVGHEYIAAQLDALMKRIRFD